MIKKVLLEVALISVIALPLMSFAQQTPPSGTIPSDLVNIVNNITAVLLWIFWALVIIFGVWTAFSYLTAGGDKEKLDSAKKRFIFLIVAIAIVAAIYLIRTIVVQIIPGGIAPEGV